MLKKEDSHGSEREAAAFSPLSGALGEKGKKTYVRGQRKSAALRPQNRRPRTRKRTAAELSNPPRCRRCSRRPSTTRRRGSARLAPSRSKLPSQPRALSGTPCASARRRSPPRRRWQASLLFTASPNQEAPIAGSAAPLPPRLAPGVCRFGDGSPACQRQRHTQSTSDVPSPQPLLK